MTEALIFLGELDPEAVGPAIADATHYEPTPVADFTALMRALPPHAFDAVFVDAGAGMGRAVLLATLEPFGAVLGIELSPALCRTASENLARWRSSEPPMRCRDVRLRCGDVLTARLPRGPLCVYLYNPFGAASIARLLDRLETRDEAVTLIYHTPVHRATIDERAEWRVHAELPFGVIYALPSMPRSR